MSGHSPLASEVSPTIALPHCQVAQQVTARRSPVPLAAIRSPSGPSAISERYLDAEPGQMSHFAKLPRDTPGDKMSGRTEHPPDQPQSKRRRDTFAGLVRNDQVNTWPRWRLVAPRVNCTACLMKDTRCSKQGPTPQAGSQARRLMRHPHGAHQDRLSRPPESTVCPSEQVIEVAQDSVAPAGFGGIAAVALLFGREVRGAESPSPAGARPGWAGRLEARVLEILLRRQSVCQLVASSDAEDEISFVESVLDSSQAQA